MNYIHPTEYCQGTNKVVKLSRDIKNSTSTVDCVNVDNLTHLLLKSNNITTPKTKGVDKIDTVAVEITDNSDDVQVL